MVQTFMEGLARRPVIAAARDMAGAKRAAGSAAEAIFLLGGSILTLEDMVRAAKESGKRVFVHLDLLEGLGNDAAAVEWCAKNARPDGLISTRSPLLRQARACSLLTIQRLFVMDSSSLAHGVKLLAASKPDMIEVLPGLVPKAITQLRVALPQAAIIAGGMVTDRREVALALEAGALAVSTSEPALWDMDRAELTQGGRT